MKVFKISLLSLVSAFFGVLLTGNIDSVNAASESTITLSISGDNNGTLALDLAPVSPNGNFASSSNLSINVTLSGPGGYVLSIKGDKASDNPDRLINTSDSTKYFSSLEEPILESAFSATDASGAAYNNQWGYKPSHYHSEPNISNTWYPAPSTTGDVLASTSGTDESGSYTLAIGARASTDTTAGSYSNTFIITAIANLSCNPNATSIVEALCLQDFNNTSSVTIDGVATTHRAAIIESMVEGVQYQLRDNRDWKPYYIAKQIGGKVWMTENLDLDVSKYTTLTSNDTNLTDSNFANYTKSGDTIIWTVPSTLKTPATINANTNAVSGYTNSGTVPYMAKTINPSNSSQDADIYAYFDVGTKKNKVYIGLSQCTDAGYTVDECAHYKVGKYYNWAAATAGSGGTAANAFASNSLCPAGWRLADGTFSVNSPSEYNILLYTGGVAQKLNVGVGESALYTTGDPAGNVLIQSNPLYLIMAGQVNASGLTSFNSNHGGYYWSNAGATTSSSAYCLFFGASNPKPNQSSNKNYGKPLRCVAGSYGSATIKFDANGGEGSMNDQSIASGQHEPITPNAFTKSGAVFVSWNTAPDGSGATYDDKAQYVVPADTSTTVTLYAQWGTPIGIQYLKNASDNAVVGTMGRQTINDLGSTLTRDQSVTLLASNYSRTGYGFAGWNTKSDYTGTFYGPHETITTPSDATSDIILYAVWVASAGSLQDASTVASVCSQLTKSGPSITKSLASVSALTDQRDNQTYAIAKLADGNCWMIENLRLDAEYTRSSANRALAQGYVGQFAGLANPETPFTGTAAMANSLYYSGTQSGIASIDIGTTNYPYTRIPRYNNTNTSNRPSYPSSNNLPEDTTTPGMYSFGNYYNWSAVMANTNYYSSPESTDANGKTSDTVNTSICPSGWRLPYGNSTGNGASSGGFYNLNYEINAFNATDSVASLRLRSFPNNFLLSGYLSNMFKGRNEYGVYPTSTSLDDTHFYALRLYPEKIDVTYNGWEKQNGRSVRCVYLSQ